MSKFNKIIDKYQDKILQAERYLWANPETGYREVKTNAYMADIFEKLGYKLDRAENITGFTATLDTGKEGPTLLVLAELDSLKNFTHPDCDKETGAVHSCGHHAQCAAMVGVATALKEDGALDGLSGKIKLCLVPAEEGIEVSYRKGLIEKGIISFSSGKPEFIKRGFFDDVDLAFMVHAAAARNNEKFRFGIGSNGVIRKTTRFIGLSAHAGSNPDKGINALNAANTALITCNSLRETFREEDYVRFHSIITKGGDAVNAVPDEVVIESYVRAASVKALKEANEKVNRTFAACAAAFGAKVEISDMAGSEALHDNKTMTEIAVSVAEKLAGKDGYEVSNKWTASSTDMGDVSALFPSIHAYACGAKNPSHSNNYFIADPVNACVDNAKFQLGLIEELLKDGAREAKRVMENFTPQFKSIEEYLQHKYSISKDRNAVIYNDDGTVTLNYKG